MEVYLEPQFGHFFPERIVLDQYIPFIRRVTSSMWIQLSIPRLAKKHPHQEMAFCQNPKPRLNKLLADTQP
jgi:hypothetical protein